MTSLQYVLPLGRPTDEGGLTNPPWHIFVQWILQLADYLIIWTQCSHAEVREWSGITHDAEMETITHPDPACTLKGYRLSGKVLDLQRVSRVRVSEESGVAFFSWTKGDAVLASIEVDDFENFAILNVELADAERLANACAVSLWDRDRLLAYKAEIDELTTGQWIPLNDLLDSRSLISDGVFDDD